MKTFFRNSGIQAGLASALFLGVIPVFGKQSIIVGFSPLAVTALRTTIAMLLLLSIMLVFKRQFFYIYPIGLAGCFMAGTINGLGSLLYYSAIQHLDTSVAQLIYSFYPIFVAFLLFLDRSPISKITIFRLALSIPGVYLLLDLSGNSVDIGGYFNDVWGFLVVRPAFNYQSKGVSGCACSHRHLVYFNRHEYHGDHCLYDW